MMPLREEAPQAAPPALQPCAFQACGRPAWACPVVTLPPPAVTRNGQPLRIVFRRSPVCHAHRHEMVNDLAPHLREAITAYCERRALPPVDWEVAAWEFEPLEGP